MTPFAGSARPRGLAPGSGALLPALAATSLALWMVARAAEPDFRGVAAAAAPAATAVAPYGGIEAEFAVDVQGVANYRVDLELPPGTSGVAPELSLVYRSQQSNSTLGVGWTLAGLPSIGRCAATWAQDGFRGGVRYDGRDRLCADGMRLVVEAGEYWAPAAVYRTERESWSRIEASPERCGSGPCSLRLTGATGEILELGGTEDSRARAEGRDDVRVWAISSYADTHGNSWRVSYRQDRGEIYPERIVYTANDSTAPPLAPRRAVELDWEARPDPLLRWIGGSRVETALRLARVRTCVGDVATGCDGAEPAMTYRLDYTESAATGRSLLAAIEACGRDGSCTRPTSFDWRAEQPGFATSRSRLPGPLFSVYEERGAIEGLLQDVDGDGIADYSRATYFPASGKSDLRVHLGTRDGGFVDSGFDLPGPLYWTTESGTVRTGVVADFDGDGLADYSAALRNEDAGTSDLRIFRGTGHGFEPAPGWQLPGPLFLVVEGRSLDSGVLQDLDGDGVADYSRATVWRATGVRELEVWAGRPGGFAATGRSLPGPVFEVDDAGSRRIGLLQDLDGDGVADYSAAYVDDARGIRDLRVHLGVTPDWRWTAAFDLPGQVFWRVGELVVTSGLLGDLNGDGIADYSRATRLTNSGSDLLEVFYGTGDGYVPAAYSLPGPVFVVGDAGWFKTGDLTDRTGDGWADFTRGVRHLATGQEDLRLFRGSTGGFLDSGESLPAPLFLVGDVGTVPYGSFEDANGDALPDSVTAFCPDPVSPSLDDCALDVRLALGPLPDLIERIRDGWGGEREVAYLPMTDDAVYARSTTSVPWAVEVEWPWQLVREVAVSTGAGDAPDRQTYRYRYSYRGGRSDRLGRGFLGFAELILEDVAAATTTRTRFEQRFPLTGVVAERVVERSGDGRRLGSARYAHRTVQPSPGVDLVLLESEESVVVDLEGDELQTRTRYDYDRWGNAVLEHRDGNLGTGDDDLDVCREFLDSEQPRRIGLLVDEVLAASCSLVGDRCECAEPLARSRWRYTPAGDLAAEALWDDFASRSAPDGSWLTTDYGYDAWGNLTSERDAVGTTRWEFDVETRTFAVRAIDALGQAVTTRYDPRFGAEVERTDLNGHRFERRLDDLGRVVETLGPDETGDRQVTLTSSTRTWTGSSSLVATAVRVDWSGDEWRSVEDRFDGLVRLVERRTTGPAPQTPVLESWRYDTETRIRFRSKPRFAGDPESGTTLSYDDFGRLAGAVAADGTRLALESDVDRLDGVPALRIVQREAAGTPDERTTRSWVDVEEELVARQYAPETGETEGARVRFRIDRLGRRVRTEAPLEVTETVYDSLDRVRVETSTSRGRTDYDYDPEGRLRRIADAAGRVQHLDYDALERVVETRIEGGDRVEYVWDQADHRNGIGSLTTIRALDGDTERYRYEIGYDPYGGETALVRRYGDRVYVFSSRQNAVGETVASTYPDGTELTLRYDGAGNLVTLALCEPSSDCRQSGGWRTYLDARGYDALGLPGEVVSPLALGGGALRSSFTYGALGESRDHRVATERGTLLDRTYSWNARHSIRSIDDRVDPAASQRFEYSPAGSLRRAEGPWGALEYEYLPSGDRRRTTRTRDGVRSETSYSYTGTRLTAVDRDSVRVATAEYDATGNLVARESPHGRRSFRFGPDDRLAAIVDAGDSGTLADERVLYEFESDHSGRRIRRHDATAEADTLYVDQGYEEVVGADGSRTRTLYLNAPWGRIASITRAGGADSDSAAALRRRADLHDTATPGGIARRWLLLLRAAGRDAELTARAAIDLRVLLAVGFALLGATGWRRRPRPRVRAGAWHTAAISFAVVCVAGPAPLPAAQDPSAGGGYPQAGVLFFVQDPVGSVQLAVDDAGEVVSSLLYQPFGEWLEPPAGDRYRDKYAGTELDEASGLYAMGERYYDPELGRFVSADVRLAGGPDVSATAYNRYAYAMNDPVTFADPTGEAVQIAAIVVAVIVIAVSTVIGAYVGAAIVNHSFNPLDWDWTSGKTYLGLAAGAAIGFVSGVITVVAPYALGGGVVAEIVAGGLAGFFENAAFAALDGASPGEILLAGAVGAVLGAVTAGTGPLLARGGARLLRAGATAAEEVAEEGGTFARRALQECLCFAAGTEVATADGGVPIEEVEVGDGVWSWDENRDELGIERVYETAEREAPATVRVRFAGLAVDATPEHRFQVAGRGWVDAGDLRPGDRLVSLLGEAVTVDAVELRPEPVRVYNLEVERAHTYFVTGARVLVHNPACSLIDGKKATATYKKIGPNQRIASAAAKFSRKRLGGGTGTNPKTRAHVRAFGLATDDAGHVFARRLGGAGHKKKWVFPQNPSINRGAFRVFESKIYDKVNKYGKGAAIVRFRYHGNSLRPYQIIYKVTIDRSAVGKPKKILLETFGN